jgi:hypothetical protein
LKTLSVSWRLERRDRLVLFRLPVPGVTCVFLTRTEGVSWGHYESLNLAFGNGDDPDHIRDNYDRVCRTLGLSRILTFRQHHSPEVLYVNYDKIPGELLDADGMYTDRTDLALGIKVADCLPVYLFGLDSPVVGLAHAGWRGTRDRIVERLVNAVRRKFGTAADRLACAFGPCIAGSCYEVGEDVAAGFRAGYRRPQEFLRSGANGRFLLDLKAANRQVLRELGVVELAGIDLCTHCAPALFFSARRDGVTGRNLAVIVRHQGDHATS